MIDMNELIPITQFVYEVPRMVIQCCEKADVPYVKRGLIGVLGTPDNNIDDVLKYGQHKIAIVPVLGGSMSIGWLEREDNSFYVSRDNHRDTYVMYMADIAFDACPYNHIKLLRNMGLTFKEIAQVIQEGLYSVGLDVKAEQYIHQTFPDW